MTLHTIWHRGWPAITLIALFCISLLLRASSFTIDPIASAGYTPYQRFNNNEVWIHNKIVFDVYEKHPFTTHRFASYIGGDSGSEFLRNKKDDSLVVYTSFPAAHFAVPYITLKTIGAPLTFTSLQIFGLAIHALCAGLLYCLLWLLTRNKLVAATGASVYIFATPTLQHHMNVYWAHQLLMPVFLCALIAFVRGNGILRWWQGLLLGCAMSLITWTGAVATIGFTVYGAYKFYRTKDRAYLSYVWMLGGMVVALACILAQVLVVTGTSLPEYLQKVAHRAQARSAGAMYTSPAVLLWHLVNDLAINYGGYAIIAYTLTAVQRLRGLRTGVLFVASFPLLETFILLEHDTVYGFGLLKWLIPIILVLGFAGARYVTTRRRAVLFVGLVAAANVVHALLFLTVYQKV